MSSYNALQQEKTAGAAVISPQTVNTGAGTVSSSPVNAGNFEQLCARVNIGTVGAADVVITIRQGQGSAMGNAKTLAVYTVAAATPPSGKLVVMTVRGELFDANNGFNYAVLDIAHDEATGGPIGAELQGSDGPYQPSSDFNASSVITVAYPPPTS